MPFGAVTLGVGSDLIRLRADGKRIAAPEAVGLDQLGLEESLGVPSKLRSVDTDCPAATGDMGPGVARRAGLLNPLMDVSVY